MKSAREIACTDKMGDCGAWREPVTDHHSIECDARTEAIEQARVDGAKWMMAKAMEMGTRIEWDVWPNPVDVRSAGDDGDAGKGGT